VSESVIQVAIRQLRQVLGDQARTPRFIETVYGRGYRFIAPINAPASAQGAAMMGGQRPVLPPIWSRPSHFVGRDAALAQLAQWWTTARQGTRQVGMIVGEPGIGKTALVDTFVTQVSATEDVWVGHGQCLDHYGVGEPYLPVLEALGRLGRGSGADRLVLCLRHYAPGWLVQLPALLPSAEWEALQRTTGGATQTRMLRELTDALEALTAERPLVLVLEDLHWSDMSTLEWLTAVAHRRDPARLFILGTYRPVDAIVRAHPIRTVMLELTQHRQGAELPLDSLSEAEVSAYLSRRFGGLPLVADLARELHQRTRGHPLFLVTIVDELRRQGLLREEATGWDVSKTVEAIRGAVPDSLRQIIEQQLSHVRPEDQELLEAASLAGREFSAAALTAVSNQGTEDIEARLDALARQGQFLRAGGLVAWPDGTVAAGYSFRHDLYREILYDRVPPSRQRRWHLQIGTRKEAGYGARAREIAAELAVHFVQGRDLDRAVHYLRYAGENALQRSAYHEAATHLTKGVEVVQLLPDTPTRAQQELDLRIALGPALMAIKGPGDSEVEQVYTWARVLCTQVGETLQLFPVLWGLREFYNTRGELQTARELGEQGLALAERQHDPALVLEAHAALAATLFYLGEFAAACSHAEQGLALYDPQQHRHLAHRGAGQDVGVLCLNHLSASLGYLGYADQALQRSREMVTLARGLAHPLSLAAALSWTARFHQIRREPQVVHELADAVIALAIAQGFPQWWAQGIVLRGWALAEQGQAAEGVAQIRQGLAAWQATGAEIGRQWRLLLLAEAQGHMGQTGAGLATLAEALAVVARTGDRRDEAEIHRLTGEFLLRQAGPSEPQAEACFRQALHVARRQQAKALELRVAMSLSRLWRQQGKRVEARQLLTEIYGWFTEGFDTADLQEAKVLLDALA
jgi:predicted ATPase